MKQIGWHGWAMVYIPPWGWLPVDLTYVLDGLDKDPLNAIKRAGVVALQEVIQYMNLTKTDYIVSRRRTGEFLQENNFYVYEVDEMTQIASGGWQGTEGWLQWTLIVLVTAASITIAIYTYFEKRKKEKTSELTQHGREPSKLR